MRVKGLGGVFLRSKDVTAMREWYARVLRIELEEWNGKVMFPEEGNMTIFSLFEQDSKYFPLEQHVMLNFQVEDIHGFIQHFTDNGVNIVKEVEESEYGTFVWIEDPEGRQIEIWENVEEEK